MGPVIRFDGVTKRHGLKVALDNGAGKTTTVRLLLGLAEQQPGQMRVKSQPGLQTAPQIRQQTGGGGGAERPALDDWMRVEEIGRLAAGLYAEGFVHRI